jgi:hypothetical protein
MSKKLKAKPFWAKRIKTNGHRMKRPQKKINKFWDKRINRKLWMLKELKAIFLKNCNNYYITILTNTTTPKGWNDYSNMISPTTKNPEGVTLFLCNWKIEKLTSKLKMINVKIMRVKIIKNVLIILTVIILT